ncbi:hypothetical protein S40293_03786 [Stachybotrys chartarum IBT 40293]|nr:hypothetical protein S40293_03786 [Stachybotrys chartarum IBT 40293]
MSRPLTVNGHVFSVADADPAADASTSNYIYITGKGHISAAQKRELADLGATVLDYWGQNTYLCRYNPPDLAPLRSLDYLQQVNVFPRQLKTSAPLAAALEAASGGVAAASAGEPEAPVFRVDVMLHKGADPVDQVVQDIIQRTGLDPESLTRDHDIIRLTATAETIAQIQDIDSVHKIEKVVDKKLFNNLARIDINVHGEEFASAVGFKGQGETVAVADTGFDLGNIDDVHPAFTGRVKALISEGRKTKSGKTDDPDGHGTHCAGSVLGDGESTAMGGKIQGTAPQASLVMQSLLSSDRGGGLWVPPNLWNLFEPPYKNHDARVASNSWGLNWDERQVEYDTEATAVDGFIWHNQDHVIVFAAGNDGEETSPTNAHIGSTSAAKNIICVGATHSTRPNANFQYNPDSPPGDPKEVAAFSSRGPTLEGRLKPDVVAPGVAILSAASRAVPASRLNAYGPTKDNLWMFSSGTSMATPLVSGCCAVLREAAREKGSVEKPSAALIKALAINGAVDIGKPRAEQGFGRIDMERSLASITQDKAAGPFGFADVGDDGALGEDDTWTHEVSLDLGSGSVPATTNGDSDGDKVKSRQLKVTLAFSDRKGQEIQNKLSLKVEVKVDGSTVFEKAGQDESGEENNVEQVVWDVTGEAASGATVVVTVTADRITRLDDKQAFAVVWATY